MINIAICDDEVTVLEELDNKIKNYMTQKQIGYNLSRYIRGEQLFSCSQDYDIVFLDIKMNGIDGIETAKRLRSMGNESHLVFITVLKEYVFDAFEVDAINYLLKPIDEQKLYITLDRIVSRVLNERDKYLSIVNRQEFKKIKLSAIMYCEVLNHTTFLHTIESIEKCNYKIEHLETELDEKFFRCHRSYILNFKYVVCYKAGLAILTNGGKIPIAKRRQQEFLKALLLFQRKEVR